MKIVRLNHAHITVPLAELDKAREFYCEVLGFREIPKPESLKRGYVSFWVELGDLQLHVGGQEGGFDRHESDNHMAYEVDELEPFRERLEALGFEMSPMVYYPGYRRFEFRDPWGNRTELTRTATEEEKSDAEEAERKAVELAQQQA